MGSAMLVATTVLATYTAATPQPVNIDFNTHYASPAGGYGAAAGQAGHWNATNGESIELLDLEGAPLGIKLSFPMGAGPAFVVNPFLEGDVHTLVDDGFVTGDVVHRAHFDGLANATYEVYAYTAPIGDITTFFIEAGGESNFFNIPGDWNGDLEEGVNYALATVEVTDGTLDVDWVGGIFGGSGWIQGVQLVPAGGCAPDVNGDGVLNILDFVAFQGLFVNGDPAADCDDNGALNVLDFVCFQGLFQAGCD